MTEKVYNVQEDLGDGLTRGLFGIDGNDWWEYHYFADAPDGRRFSIRVPVTPELVDSEGPDAVRSMIEHMWADALAEALEREGVVSDDVVMIRTGGDRDMFRATIEDGANDYWFGAVVDEVTAWAEDGSPVEFEPYLHCTIKWDSCSHFRFGEPTKGSRGDRDGYLHLCGVDDFRRHVALMEELYRLAFERMGREPEPDERWDR